MWYTASYNPVFTISHIWHLLLYGYQEAMTWQRSGYLNLLKVDMPILSCIFCTFNWLTLTSEMHFVKFHSEVASCLLSRSKKVCTPGDEAIMKIHKKLFSGIPINCTFFVISPKLQRIWSWNFGFTTRKIWAFIWYQKMYYFRLSPGDENVIGIRSFNQNNKVTRPFQINIAKLQKIRSVANQKHGAHTIIHTAGLIYLAHDNVNLATVNGYDIMSFCNASNFIRKCQVGNIWNYKIFIPRRIKYFSSSKTWKQTIELLETGKTASKFTKRNIPDAVHRLSSW